MMDYEEIGKNVGRLVASKQVQYGNSFQAAGQIMRILYPTGVPIDGLDQALTVVRVLDKLKRIATAAGEPDPGGENPWRDIAGYALLELARNSEPER